MPKLDCPIDKVNIVKLNKNYESWISDKDNRCRRPRSRKNMHVVIILFEAVRWNISPHNWVWFCFQNHWFLGPICEFAALGFSRLRQISFCHQNLYSRSLRVFSCMRCVERKVHREHNQMESHRGRELRPDWRINHSYASGSE